VVEQGASVSAPSSGLSDLARRRELIFLLVGRDLKVRYKRSALGMLWTLLNPLLQMTVYTLVFSTIMRIAVPQFPVFLLSGLLPWSLVSVSATSSAHALLDNQGLIRKVAVPQAVYPLAIVGSKLVDMVLSLLPLAIIAAALGRTPGPTWILVLPAIVLAASFAAGLSLFFSSVTVFFRDVRHLIDILFQIWFYLTPIIYPYDYLAKLPYPAIRSLLSLNPATPIVRWFQVVLYEGRVPDATTAALATGSALGALALGAAVFHRFEDRHIHYF
jgi:ABC-type polysaccharide/polyol phosphate export permease